jgi:hypothetical protein
LATPSAGGEGCDQERSSDADRPMRFERFAAVSCALVEIVIGEWCCVPEAMSSLIISLMSSARFARHDPVGR